MADSGRYIPDVEDISFVLFEHLDLTKSLAGSSGNLSEDDVRMIIQLGSEFATEVVAPTNAVADRTGCRWENGKVSVPAVFHSVWKTLREQGWIGLTAPVAYGGQGLPRLLGIAVDEMIVGANPAFQTYAALCRAAANLLVHHASESIKRVFVPRIVSGEWQGTMCLTESGAGSDVGASLTRAIPAGDGAYRIAGTKTFITAGEHDLTTNHVHLVLARLPGAPPGVKGLSLFLVPKIRVDAEGGMTSANDVYCSKIEEKMGIHGSATTVLHFGDRNQCLGFLIGEEHQGIRCMFDMMNEERIGVGLQGQALAAAMYAQAAQYARQRLQGSDISQGKSFTDEKVPIIQHPDVRRMLMTIRSVAEGGRALLYYTSLQLDLAESAGEDLVRSCCAGRAALLTPICKAWSSDSGLEACSQALQVYGGSGFIRDFPAEQYFRDVRIASIYEGTNGIQALDLLFRKALGTDLLTSLYRDIAEWIGKNTGHAQLAAEIGALNVACKELLETTSLLGQCAKRNMRQAALNASPYLTLVGNVVVGWLLLQQAVIAASKLEGSAAAARLFCASKIETARFFTHQMLTQNRWKAAQIASGDSSAFDITL